jgi:hypothetical protein
MFIVANFFIPNTIREVKKKHFYTKTITWHYVNITEHDLAGEGKGSAVTSILLLLW